MFSGLWTPRCLSPGPGFKFEVPSWLPQASILHPPRLPTLASLGQSPQVPHQRKSPGWEASLPKGQRPQRPGSPKSCQVGGDWASLAPSPFSTSTVGQAYGITVPGPGADKLETVRQIWPSACLCKESFMGTQPHPFACTVVGCFPAAAAELRS